MGVPPRRLFSKLGDNTKKFFSKDTANTAKDIFRKTEAVVKQVKKEAPGVIDEALRKTSSTLKEAAPIVGKIGTGISMAAPALAAVPGIGVGLAAAAGGAGTALQKSEKGIKKLGKLTGDIRQETTLKKGSGIQAAKPEPAPELDSELFGNLFV